LHRKFCIEPNKKRAKTTLLLIGATSTYFVQADGQKNLGQDPALQVKRVRDGAERLQRRPVGFAEIGEGFLPDFFRLSFSRAQHERPMRSLK